MKAQARMSRYLPLLIAAGAVILFSTAGAARMMGWGQTAGAGADGIPALDEGTPVPERDSVAAGSRCPECGIIVSIREIVGLDEGGGPDAAGGAPAAHAEEVRAAANRNHEITVRMADGSIRVDNHLGPASWRPGERVIVIGGANPSRP